MYTRGHDDRGKVRGPCFKYYTHLPLIFSQRNLTLRENECRFKTYMSLLYTNTRRKSLYDKIDAELIEIFYRIKLNKQIHRIHVPPSNIKHIHV